MRKAQGWDNGLFSSELKCCGQSVQAAYRAISLTCQSRIFISSEFAQTSETGLGSRLSSRLCGILGNNMQNIFNLQFSGQQASLDTGKEKNLHYFQCLQLSFFILKVCKGIIMCKAAKAKCFGNANMRSILKGCT